MDRHTIDIQTSAIEEKSQRTVPFELIRWSCIMDPAQNLSRVTADGASLLDWFFMSQTTQITSKLLKNEWRLIKNFLHLTAVPSVYEAWLGTSHSQFQAYWMKISDVSQSWSQAVVMNLSCMSQVTEGAKLIQMVQYKIQYKMLVVYCSIPSHHHTWRGLTTPSSCSNQIGSMWVDKNHQQMGMKPTPLRSLDEEYVSVEVGDRLFFIF